MQPHWLTVTVVLRRTVWGTIGAQCCQAQAQQWFRLGRDVHIFDINGPPSETNQYLFNVCAWAPRVGSVRNSARSSVAKTAWHGARHFSKPFATSSPEKAWLWMRCVGRKPLRGLQLQLWARRFSWVRAKVTPVRPMKWVSAASWRVNGESQRSEPKWWRSLWMSSRISCQDTTRWSITMWPKVRSFDESWSFASTRITWRPFRAWHSRGRRRNPGRSGRGKPTSGLLRLKYNAAWKRRAASLIGPQQLKSHFNVSLAAPDCLRRPRRGETDLRPPASLVSLGQGNARPALRFFIWFFLLLVAIAKHMRWNRNMDLEQRGLFISPLLPSLSLAPSPPCPWQAGEGDELLPLSRQLQQRKRRDDRRKTWMQGVVRPKTSKDSPNSGLFVFLFLRLLLFHWFCFPYWFYFFAFPLAVAFPLFLRLLFFSVFNVASMAKKFHIVFTLCRKNIAAAGR